MTVKSLCRSLKSPFEGMTNKIVCRSTQLQAINDTSPHDVFVAGYPKSGNTWVQYLIAGAIYGLDPRLAQDRLVQRLVPDVQGHRYYYRYHDTMFFKSHLLPKPNYRRVIHLVRDGRDVVVSYWHMLRKLYPERNLSLLDVIHGNASQGLWHEHAEQWLQNPFDAEMMMVRYEDLKNDAVAELMRICEFTDMPRSQEHIQSVVDGSTVEKMAKRENSGENQWHNTKWPAGQSFIRKGIVGGYKKEMSSIEIAEFMIISSKALAEYGYIID